MSNICLKPYAARKGFDYARFAKGNLKVASSFRHIPHLEDYWPTTLMNWRLEKGYGQE